MTSTLPTYYSIEDKAQNFNVKKIDTLSDFRKIVEEQKKIPGIYRGISSSKYKIYTSLQRQIITQNLQDKFQLEKYLNDFKKTDILAKYFSALKIEPSKLSIYSFLQHYGAPTPFLDFTSNFEKALYFAIENFEEKTFTSKEAIDDYFSIFFINQNDLDLIEIPKVFDDLKKIKSLSKNAFSNYEDYTEEHLTSFVDNIFSINTCNVFLISHHEEFTNIYNANNNIRIIAQEGLFIHNDYLDKPLEEALKDFFKEETIFIGSELDEIDDPQIQATNAKYLEDLDRNRDFQRRLEKNIITSFDINKSLITEIRNEFNLKREDIYPDPEIICRQIFENAIKK